MVQCFNGRAQEISIHTLTRFFGLLRLEISSLLPIWGTFLSLMLVQIKEKLTRWFFLFTKWKPKPIITASQRVTVHTSSGRSKFLYVNHLQKPSTVKASISWNRMNWALPVMQQTLPAWICSLSQRKNSGRAAPNCYVLLFSLTLNIQNFLVLWIVQIPLSSTKRTSLFLRETLSAQQTHTEAETIWLSCPVWQNTIRRL